MLNDNGRKVKQHLNYHLKISEIKTIFEYVNKHCSMKWHTALLLMLCRGLRPAECMAINICDFSDDYTRLTFREAKTNKLRFKEFIIPIVAQRIKAYIELNNHSLKEGFLFPFYTKKSNNRPYMSAQVFATWFCTIRGKIAKIHPEFNERYTFKTANGKYQVRYRINLYSFRRFFETYLYIHNKFNLALLKEIMLYSSKFDPVKHYIKFFQDEQEKTQVLQATFTPLSNRLIYGQRTIAEFAA
jgi:integrase